MVSTRQYIVRILTFLMLTALLDFSSISFAEKGKWTKKADMPTARHSLSTSTVNGKIYAIGGTPGDGRALSTVEEYDPQKDTWIKKKEMPTARGWLSTSVVNGKIYVIGGGATTSGPMLSTVEEYDPATDTWTKKADMSTAKGGFFTSVVNGKIYAISGDGAVEEYDPTIDKWAKKAADMPTKRWAFSTSAVDREIYAIGGTPGRGVSFSTVEAYDTGFAGLYIEARGKLPTSWGKIKSSY